MLELGARGGSSFYSNIEQTVYQHISMIKYLYLWFLKWLHSAYRVEDLTYHTIKERGLISCWKEDLLGLYCTFPTNKKCTLMQLKCFLYLRGTPTVFNILLDTIDSLLTSGLPVPLAAPQGAMPPPHFENHRPASHHRDNGVGIFVCNSNLDCCGTF